MAADTVRISHKVYEKDQIGEVQIADEVVAIIAGLAATEVEGVDSMAGNITNELVGKLGMKNLSKGVKAVSYTHLDVYKRQAGRRAVSCDLEGGGGAVSTGISPGGRGP